MTVCLHSPPNIRIYGKCFGVEIRQRSPRDGDCHALLKFLVKDDGRWHDMSSPPTISSHWIDDIREVFSRVAPVLLGLPIDPSGFGRLLVELGPNVHDPEDDDCQCLNCVPPPSFVAP